MSNKLILHIDGSEVIRKNDRSLFSGWAVIALHGDQLHENSGCISSGKDVFLTGYHEQIAFVNGVLYARSQGFDFKNVSVFCDDECFGNAPATLHPGNYRTVQSERLLERLKHVVHHCFEPQALPLTLAAFNQCMITKVKGHSRHVYQERADYLAKFSANSKSKEDEIKTSLSFEDWLTKGINQYKIIDGKNVFETWYAPFVDLNKDSLVD